MAFGSTHVASQQGHRDYMEDYHCDVVAPMPDGSPVTIAGVFDGHGGSEVAEIVSTQLPSQLLCLARTSPLLARTTSNCDGDDAIKAVRSIFARLDDEMRRQRDSMFGWWDSESGSTACVAIVTRTAIVVCNTGDSRCILRTRDDLVPMSTDHKPELNFEMQRIYEQPGGFVSRLPGDAARVQGTLSVSRAFGDWSLRPYVVPTPDVTVRPRTGADLYLLIATDGFWDVMSNRDARAEADRLLVAEGRDGLDTARRLVQTALDRGSTDNVTVALVDLRT